MSTAFNKLRKMQKARYAKQVAKSKEEEGGFIFTVGTAEGIWDAYLSGFEGDDVAFSTCNACRRALRQMGGRVRIDSEGDVHPLLWGKASDKLGKYRQPVAAVLAYLKEQTNYTLVLDLARDAGFIGTPDSSNSEWTHIYIENPAVGQVGEHSKVVQKLNEENDNLLRNLEEYYPGDLLERAIAFMDLHGLGDGWTEQLLNHITVRDEFRVADSTLTLRQYYAATAHEGDFTWRLNNTVLGKLLDDLKSERSVQGTVGAWKEMTKGENYCRPKAMPTLTAKKAARKYFDETGQTPALARRHETRAEVLETAKWRLIEPKGPVVEPHIFDDIEVKDPVKVPEVQLSTVIKRLTYQTFCKRLQEEGVTKVELVFHRDLQSPIMVGFTTCSDPEAPVLFKHGDNRSMAGLEEPRSSAFLSENSVEIEALVTRPGQPSDTVLEDCVIAIIKELPNPAYMSRYCETFPGYSLFANAMNQDLFKYRSVFEPLNVKAPEGELDVIGLSLASIGGFLVQITKDDNTAQQYEVINNIE